MSDQSQSDTGSHNLGIALHFCMLWFLGAALSWWVHVLGEENTIRQALGPKYPFIVVWQVAFVGLIAWRLTKIDLSNVKAAWLKLTLTTPALSFMHSELLLELTGVESMLKHLHRLF